jgi:hypothetical protein
MWKKIAVWIAQALLKAVAEKAVTEIQEKTHVADNQRSGPPTG